MQMKTDMILNCKKTTSRRSDTGKLMLKAYPEAERKQVNAPHCDEDRRSQAIPYTQVFPVQEGLNYKHKG